MNANIPLEENRMNHHFFNKIFVGLLLIAAGILFLMNQMGYISINIGMLFREYWPLILIYFGLKGIFVRGQYGWNGSYLWGIFVILLGLMFLGGNLGMIAMSFHDMFKYLIPLLLIMI